jgi:hypothetical protein
MTESPENAEMAAEIVALDARLNDMASVQGSEIPQPNNEISALSNAISLTRTYTPEPGPAPPPAGALGAELETTATITPAPDPSLAEVMNEMKTTRFPTGSLPPVSPDGTNPTWTAELPAQEFNSAGLDTSSQELQTVSTQLTTDVQTSTAQAAQTTQMSNTMIQEASSVLTNLLDEDEAAAKE